MFQRAILVKMIITTRHQIPVYLVLLLLIYCKQLIHGSRLVSSSDSQLDFKKILPSVKPHDISTVRSEIINTTSVRWYIDFTSSYSKHHILVNPDINITTEATVNVSYQIIYSELYRYRKKIFCQMKERIAMDQDPKIYTRRCKEDLNSFRALHFLMNQNIVSFEDHCSPKVKTFKFLNIHNDTAIHPMPQIVAMDDLLPHQAYQFNFTYYIHKFNYTIPVETLSEIICMPDGPPQVSPQTELASFSISKDNEYVKSRVVDLYWRPTPLILAGAADLAYNVYCETDLHVQAINATVDSIKSGRLRIDKPPEHSFMCLIRSKNHIGYGPGHSYIVIPDKDHLIELGSEFRFYAYAINARQVMLEWTPVEFDALTGHVSILPRLGHTSGATKEKSDGNFTIYYCQAGMDDGCTNLAGMMTTNSTSAYTLILPETDGLEPLNLLFGISYLHANPGHSTGIIWAKCVANSAHLFITERMRISRVAPIENNHTALSLAWDFDVCDSQVVIIDSYQIIYCKLEELTSCSVIWSNFEAMNPAAFQFEEDSSRCKTVSFPNNLYNEQVIANLTSASRYIIRIRYLLANGTANSWSEPKSASTLPDPVVVHSCWKTFKWNLAGFAIIISVLLAICCARSRSWFYQCNMLHLKFKQTTGGICSFVADVAAKDSMNDVTFKYFLNVGEDKLASAQSELSLSFLAQDERKKLTGPEGTTSFDDRHSSVNNGFNQLNQIFDYIPKNLIDGSTDDNVTPETASDTIRDELKYENSSEQDEISINSHPFVWDTNSSYELDFNNNQTSK